MSLSKQVSDKKNQIIGPLVVTLAFAGSYLKDFIDESSLIDKKVQINFKISDHTALSGIQFTHQVFKTHKSLSNVEPWLASTAGASVAVVDFDNDGYQDIYFTNSKVGSENHLYRNNKNGTFSNVADELNVATVNTPYPSTSSVFFDCDNDGYKDLLLISFCPKLLKNENGVNFKDVTSQSEIGSCFPALTAANVIDYNYDGKPDLILGGYFNTDIINSPSTTHVMPENSLNSKNSSPIFLYENLGKCQFQKKKNWYAGRGYNFSVGIYHSPINKKSQKTKSQYAWISSDFGMDHLLKLSSPEFPPENISEKIVTRTTSRNGMSVDFADPFNDGSLYAYVSHIHVRRERPSGNLLWKHEAEGPFSEHSREKNVHRCGWSWGAKFVDLNNDSFQDLAVVNGFISSEKSKVKKNYWFHANTMNSGFRKMASDAKLWPPMTGFSIEGYQRDCLFLNDGNEFHNITNMTDWDIDHNDGRGVAYIDHLNSGSLSLVVANQNGPARFYLNQQKNENKWIGFHLIGTQGTKDAFGARVVLLVSNQTTLQKELQPINGFSSQSDGRLHFGLGKESSISSVEIFWPSGQVQSIPIKSIKTNSYNTIIEE